MQNGSPSTPRRASREITMDSMHEPDLPQALLRWVSSFDLLPGRAIPGWRDLQDGQILWRILVQIDPDYFSGDLPEPPSATADSWIPRWQNLKHIERLVTSFIRDEHEKLPYLSKDIGADLKAIAIDASPEDSLKLVEFVIAAALYSPKSNAKMIKVMTTELKTYADPIARLLAHMDEVDRRLGERDAVGGYSSDAEGMMSPARAGTPHNVHRDPELEREEQLIAAVAKIKEQEDKIASLLEGAEQRRTHNEALEKELVETRQQLEQGGQAGANSEVVNDLRQSALRDKDYIAELETELDTARTSAESTERQLDRLKKDSEGLQKLRDELQMMRVERDDLVQKSKANENLKKKIQTLQESDKSNQSVRSELESAQEEIKALQTYKDRCMVLQRQHTEYQKTISNGEQQIFDMMTQRKRLEHDLKVYTSRYEAARERQQRDGEQIAEQEEKIKALEAGQGKGVVSSDTLDDELETGDQQHATLRARIAELEAENAKIKYNPSTPLAPQEDPTSDEAYKMLLARHEKLEKDYLNLLQENLGLDSELKETQEAHQTIESRPFVELRDRMRAETAKLSDTEHRLFVVESELSDTRVRLETAEGKFASVDKSRADALDELKRSTTAENDILAAENKRLVTHVSAVEGDLAEQKSLLRHALLDANALLKEDAELRESNEFKMTREQLASFKATGEPGEEELALAITKRVEDARSRVREVERQANEARATLESHIETLQGRVRKAEEEAKKGVAAPLQANIQRELALMSSAWYDMTSRMQSDAVIVQRRADAPRSFLNKHRRLLSSSTLPKRR